MSRRDTRVPSEYVQKTMVYTIHLFDDHFFVVDPWGQQSDTKPLSAVYKAEEGLKALQFDYEFQDHRVNGLAFPEE